MISGFEIRTEIGSAEPDRLFRALRERDGTAVLLKTCDLDGSGGRTELGREVEILRTLTGARVLNAVEHLDHPRTRHIARDGRPRADKSLVGGIRNGQIRARRRSCSSGVLQESSIGVRNSG